MDFLQILNYVLIFLALLGFEKIYFIIADRYNIVDRPNDRSSHSQVAIRGGGIIFVIALWVWFISRAVMTKGSAQLYPWMLAGVTLASAISFIDDIRPQNALIRLVVHFVAMVLIFKDLDILKPELWWEALIALVVYVGATNIYNFMDGINGITGAYSMSVLIPLLIRGLAVMDYGVTDLIIMTILAVIVFSIYNFRPRNMARCFAGDVGSIGISCLLLFFIGRLIKATGDITWLALLVVYGVDGCLTICHRILLHENIFDAHRKHAYQIMANELNMGHTLVSTIYFVLQLAISLAMMFLVPDKLMARVIYLASVIVVLCAAYILFMKKYYHLHAEYLASLQK